MEVYAFERVCFTRVASKHLFGIVSLLPSVAMRALWASSSEIFIVTAQVQNTEVHSSIYMP